MKNLAIFIAIALFSSCVTSQFLDPTDVEELQWSVTPCPRSSQTQPKSELKECFSSYKLVTKCLMKTLTKETTIGSEC
ncbi:hypothetical protein Bca52824_004926 [Brassica carinata]|uniref:Lipoprotein n=1 Tax=Brassica carinata TaxID=52824 RepID=A0A8X7WPW0_BRACI|nr:hypothetical protein Bca52824_004926 [Brassica carinata]